jgi:hypothetical protein
LWRWQAAFSQAGEPDECTKNRYKWRDHWALLRYYAGSPAEGGRINRHRHRICAMIELVCLVLAGMARDGFTPCRARSPREHGSRLSRRGFVVVR